MDVLEHIADFLSKLGGSHTITVDNRVPAAQVAPAPAPKAPLTAAIVGAIAYNETRGVKGDPYQFTRPSGSASLGRALGKYQVTEGELKTYARRYLGKSVTPQQFLSDPTIQDRYMSGKVNYFKSQGVGVPDIIAKHRGGQNATEADYPDYVKAAVAKIPPNE